MASKPTTDPTDATTPVAVTPVATIPTVKVKTGWRVSRFTHNLSDIPDITETPIEVTLEQFKKLQEIAEKFHIVLETEK